jgi:hypothetical protein
MIVNISPSKRINKRYQVLMDNGKTYDFGLKDGSTYLDHKDETLRKNYWLRHLGNNTEQKLIENLVPSPSLFSAYLLWGPYTNINKNISNLNNLWLNRKNSKKLKK